MNIFKRTTFFVTLALMGLISSLVAPVFMSGAYAADKIDLDPDVKNVSTGSGYGDQEVSNVSLDDTVRFRIKVNNVSGSELDKITVRANLNKVTGTTKHWTMDSQAEITEGQNTTSVSKPVSVFMKEDNHLAYVTGSTKISVNGAEPQNVADVAGTSPMLRSFGYVLTDVAPMTQDPQTWLYFDAKVVKDAPATPQINVQFNKEMMNVTKGSAWSKNVTADAGDTIKVRIWFHNGGVAGSSDKPATEVVIKDSMPFSSAHDFVNTATFNSKEVGPLTSQAKLTLSQAQGVSYVAGSTRLVVPTNTSNDVNVLFNTGRREVIADVNGLSALMTDSGYRYGTLQFCWEHQRFVEFEVKVGTTPTTTEVKADTLPKTGATEVVTISLVGSTMAGMYLRKFRLG
jgi:hypothetical protein